MSDTTAADDIQTLLQALTLTEEQWRREYEHRRQSFVWAPSARRWDDMAEGLHYAIEEIRKRFPPPDPKRIARYDKPPNHPTDPVWCRQCLSYVPAEVAYRDGPTPFHWNERGGGHSVFRPDTHRKPTTKETDD